MKKTIISIFLIAAIAALISVSCGSAPPATGQQLTEGGGPARGTETVRSDDQTVPAALREPIAKAEEARRRAVDFESPDYFPSDWEGLEAQYNAAGVMPRSNANEIQQAVTAYNNAADAYDDLFAKTLPLYAQAREDEVISVRDELIGTGLTARFPEYLQNVDKIALAAMDQYEAGDYYAARDTAAEALKEYETLLTGARVYLVRQEIVDRGFDVYDFENFSRADEITLAALEEYETGNKEAAVAHAEDALLRYNVVLENGWPKYAVVRRASVASERNLALSERANIAARDTFREADAIYNQAEEIFATEDFQNAAVLFVSAEALFAVSRVETEEKRQRAIETIKLAEERIEESGETAVEAERIIEGGSR